MRKDNPIDKPITVSLFGTAASATLMVAFEHTVLQSFGIDDYFDKIKSSLLSMQATRKTAKEL